MFLDISRISPTHGPLGAKDPLTPTDIFYRLWWDHAVEKPCDRLAAA